ncbi:Cysteine-rich domain protein [uncultured Desulfobacterium sp.]|uniref:Cysteine-rich domain protein n=1 Tax=uncultured Desulfobacterium sp. TaxID=201089 RepID=A0A445N433_9BACT|nr:Cysteine-rich domain protein [uncultured Desulfobacterium sp.]
MKTDLKIILFLCNWGPHAAFQTLQDTASDIPAEIKMVRIPCAGRINKALLLKSFEMGADGVALVGCESGSCRYGVGTETSGINVEEARGILDLLGLGKDRLRLGNFMPDKPEMLLRFLIEFADVIKNIGKSPVLPAPKSPSVIDSREMMRRIVAEHDIYACQDCGKCSSACPLTLAGKLFSPRAIANSIIAGDLDSDSVRKDIWACLTCGICYDRCPSAVNFPDFIRDMRYLMRKMNLPTIRSHGGFFQSLMRTMTTKDLGIRHWQWLPDDIKVSDDSEYLFFGGCAPYFDIFFKRHLKVKTMDILLDSLRLLNFFDIHPQVLKAERCCGHDLLWSGDKENFLRLAELNTDDIRRSGAKKIITACPECYRTLSRDYPRQGLKTDFEVIHIFDFLENEIDKGAVGFKRLPKSFTFQDPCRLSRLENRPDLPRRLLNRISSKNFHEMEEKGASAICCGNCAWTSCDSFSKALQVKRIRQAHDTKTDMLVTACPKCQIHFSCAMEDPFLGEELSMEMIDLTSLLAKTIQWE